MANKKGIQLYRCIDQWGADVLLKENTRHTTDGKKKKSNKGKQKEGNVKESTDDIVMNDNFFDDEFENFSSYEFDHNDYESDSNADNVLSHQDVSFSDSFRGHDPISSIPYANVPGSSAPYGLVSSSGSSSIDNHELQFVALAVHCANLSLFLDDLSHSMKFSFSFYPTKSLLYIMEMPSCLCKCITVNRKDVDYNQDSFLKL
ncbi:hypothetical protein BDB01DRAFT_855648 [Pilobolus umbonatus]|nr:hypothetical protein BDB01DRAFT_855648 [Pilobolus umbonatus]